MKHAARGALEIQDAHSHKSPKIHLRSVPEFGAPLQISTGFASCLGSVTAWHLVVGVSQSLRRCAYVQQGDHHVGHWPTF